MSFPLTFSGKLNLSPMFTDGEQIKKLQNAIIDGLCDLDAIIVVAGDQSIKFKYSMFKPLIKSKLDMLLPVSKGEVNFVLKNDIIRLSYSLNFIRTLILTLTMSVIFFIFAFDGSLYERLFDAFLLWLFLFGGNYLLVAIRFPLFIRRCVKQTTGTYLR